MINEVLAARVTDRGASGIHSCLPVKFDRMVKSKRRPCLAI